MKYSHNAGAVSQTGFYGKGNSRNKTSSHTLATITAVGLLIPEQWKSYMKSDQLELFEQLIVTDVIVKLFTESAYHNTSC